MAVSRRVVPVVRASRAGWAVGFVERGSAWCACLAGGSFFADFFAFGATDFFFALEEAAFFGSAFFTGFFAADFFLELAIKFVSFSGERSCPDKRDA